MKHSKKNIVKKTILKKSKINGRSNKKRKYTRKNKPRTIRKRNKPRTIRKRNKPRTIRKRNKKKYKKKSLFYGGENENKSGLEVLELEDLEELEGELEEKHINGMKERGMFFTIYKEPISYNKTEKILEELPRDSDNIDILKLTGGEKEDWDKGDGVDIFSFSDETVREEDRARVIKGIYDNFLSESEKDLLKYRYRNMVKIEKDYFIILRSLGPLLNKNLLEDFLNKLKPILPGTDIILNILLHDYDFNNGDQLYHHIYDVQPGRNVDDEIIEDYQTKINKFFYDRIKLTEQHDINEFNLVSYLSTLNIEEQNNIIHNNILEVLNKEVENGVKNGIGNEIIEIIEKALLNIKEDFEKDFEKDYIFKQNILKEGGKIKRFIRKFNLISENCVIKLYFKEKETKYVGEPCLESYVEKYIDGIPTERKLEYRNMKDEQLDTKKLVSYHDEFLKDIDALVEENKNKIMDYLDALYDSSEPTNADLLIKNLKSMFKDTALTMIYQRLHGQTAEQIIEDVRNQKVKEARALNDKKEQARARLENRLGLVPNGDKKNTLRPGNLNPLIKEAWKEAKNVNEQIDAKEGEKKEALTQKLQGKKEAKAKEAEAEAAAAAAKEAEEAKAKEAEEAKEAEAAAKKAEQRRRRGRVPPKGQAPYRGTGRNNKNNNTGDNPRESDKLLRLKEQNNEGDNRRKNAERKNLKMMEKMKNNEGSRTKTKWLDGW